MGPCCLLQGDSLPVASISYFTAVSRRCILMVDQFPLKEKMLEAGKEEHAAESC